MRLFIFLLLIPFLFAHGEEVLEAHTVWEKLGIPDPSFILIVGGTISAVTIVIALMITNRLNDQGKKILFFAIAAPVIIVTLYLSGTTVYLNMVSETGGPVHWHADFEIWSCNEKIELADPKGFDNKVGSSLYHGHDDDRLHIEGVLHDIKEDTQLPLFFYFIGGKLTDDELTVPTNTGLKTWKNGEACNGQNAKVQFFLYRVLDPEPDKKIGLLYEQKKITDIHDFVPAPYTNVPPGDCIIIEFDKEKEKTEKMCETYKVAIENGDLREK